MNRQELLNSRFMCRCGKQHVVPLQRAIIERGALKRTPEVLENVKAGKKAFLLVDPTTFVVAGQMLKKLLESKGCAVHLHQLSAHPHADDITAEVVASEVPSSTSVVISCGSGTITDLGKYAAFKKNLPFVAVATAPSMNGYASGIVALTQKGLKTTGAVEPAVAVIADIDILSAAPMDMIRAGLGDLLSKPVCNADWKLSSLVRGEHFCRKPFELIQDLEKIYAEQSARLAQRDPQTIAALTEAIVYSGVSMVMAGSSSPASGGEHLISHFLDMRAPFEHRTPDFHGAQVGVGTIATAMLYERMLQKTSDSFAPGAIRSAWIRGQAALSRCKEIFGPVFPSLREQFYTKWPDENAMQRDGTLIKDQWKTIVTEVTPFLSSSARLEKILRAAGAKTSFQELGVTKEVFRDALELAFCIRSRFSILDVAFLFDELEPWARRLTGSLKG